MYVWGESQTEVWLDSNRPVKHVPRKYHVILRGVASSIQTPQRQRLRKWRSALRRSQIPCCHSLNSVDPGSAAGGCGSRWRARSRSPCQAVRISIEPLALEERKREPSKESRSQRKSCDGICGDVRRIVIGGSRNQSGAEFIQATAGGQSASGRPARVGGGTSRRSHQFSPTCYLHRSVARSGFLPITSDKTAS